MDNKQHTGITSKGMKKSDEIDIIKLFIRVWRKRKFILINTCVFIIVGLFIAFTYPVSYTASCTVVPQLGNKGNNSLGGLASMIGVNLGTAMSTETLSPKVYPQIINSVPFCKEIMETQIIVQESNSETITLYDYYTDSQYSSINILGTVKKYTIGLPGVILSSLKPNSESINYISDTVTGQVIRLSKREQKIIKQVQNNIQFSINEKEGYIILGYSFSEAYPTATIAQNMYFTLEKFVKNYKSQKQLDNLAFVEKSFESAQKDFMEKQASLAAFQDSNRDLTSAMARTNERRLSSEYDVAYTVYNELAVQLEQAKISVNESAPILTVIDPVVVPNKKSAPRRAYILIIFSFLGLIVSTGWIFVKPFIKEVTNELKKEKI